MTNATLEPDTSAAWQELGRLAAGIAPDFVRNAQADVDRFARFSLEAESLFADYSRCPVTPEILTALEALADERELDAAVSEMVSGARMNNTEGRAALHMALRGTPVGDSSAAAEAQQELEAFLRFADAVREGAVAGSFGARFRTVINIGIGGSDLGPRLVARALATPADPVELRFVAGVDGIELADALVDADPASTLFIICSKTFTTLETRSNADAALAWLRQADADIDPRDHFCAVSTNAEAMDEFGVHPDWRFRIWDWVGGRYSVWSAVGLAAAIAIGSDKFRRFLAGARSMDEHFINAPFAENMPRILAMLDIWEQNFLGKNALVVLPYDQRIEFLPAYLQQLYMESQGKAVDREGRQMPVATGAAVWGTPGSHAQHSFAQWLHQGFASVTAEYVGVVNGPAAVGNNGQQLALANMLAQADALALGRSAVEIDNESAELVPHKVHPGSRSAVILLLKALSPDALGALLAHYEHRVFVQSVIWGINPFDQWGVELGKIQARVYAEKMSAGDADGLPGAGRYVLRWTDAAEK